MCRTDLLKQLAEFSRGCLGSGVASYLKSRDAIVTSDRLHAAICSRCIGHGLEQLWKYGIQSLAIVTKCVVRSAACFGRKFRVCNASLHVPLDGSVTQRATEHCPQGAAFGCQVFALQVILLLRSRHRGKRLEETFHRLHDRLRQRAARLLLGCGDFLVIVCRADAFHLIIKAALGSKHR